jgi:hypothetical protein
MEGRDVVTMEGFAQDLKFRVHAELSHASS